jgi:hypothetical protein
MKDDTTVETDLFEHKEVKPHFINPICFGEDFARWLLEELSPLKDEGFQLSDPIQEDYGWGIWISKDSDSFWIALGMMAEGPTEETPQWNVSITYDAGLNILKRLFHKPRQRSFETIRDRIWQSLKKQKGIRVVEA